MSLTTWESEHDKTQHRSQRLTQIKDQVFLCHASRSENSFLNDIVGFTLGGASSSSTGHASVIEQQAAATMTTPRFHRPVRLEAFAQRPPFACGSPAGPLPYSSKRLLSGYPR